MLVRMEKVGVGGTLCWDEKDLRGGKDNAGGGLPCLVEVVERFGGIRGAVVTLLMMLLAELIGMRRDRMERDRDRVEGIGASMLGAIDFEEGIEGNERNDIVDLENDGMEAASGAGRLFPPRPIRDS